MKTFPSQKLLATGGMLVVIVLAVCGGHDALVIAAVLCASISLAMTWLERIPATQKIAATRKKSH